MYRKKEYVEEDRETSSILLITAEHESTGDCPKEENFSSIKKTASKALKLVKN
jgi:hypothetical protein